jgi:tight adherence protein B
MFSPSTAQIAIALLAAFSIGGVIIATLYPLLAGGSRTGKRLETIAGTGRKNAAADRLMAEEGRRRRSVEETLRELEETQKAKARRSQKPTLMVRMRQAGLGWSKNTYYLICFASALVVAMLSMTVVRFGLIPTIGFAVSGGVLIPHLFVSLKRKRRFQRFTNEFPNAVDVIVRGVKAGLPLVDCLKVISHEAQEPVASEFREIVEEQTLGMPLPEAVSRLPERIPLAEANFFAIVIAIQARSGGSLSEALTNLSRVLRDRKKLAGKIRAMSAEAKSSAGIIGSLPIVVAAIVYVTSPDYILLLFQTFIGNVVLACCALWMLIGIMVMRKMINFDY